MVLKSKRFDLLSNHFQWRQRDVVDNNP